MQLTIRSRKLGREITFSRPGTSYVYVDINGKEGSLGEQLCRAGCLTGSTIIYSGSDQKRFNTICRSWMKQHLNS